MKFYITLICLTLLSLASSCQKDNPLPPEEYHRDIFRCKVNGVEWTPNCISDPLFGCDAVDCQYYWKDTKTFEIGAVNKSFDGNVNQSIGIASSFAALGVNELGLSLREYKDWNKPGNCGFYDLDTTAVRRLTILEVDTVNYLIKGTFEFTAIDNYGVCQDTVRITDGYFHVNFRF
ncbi:MAG: hypothetical protein R2787_16035 [Saprospiraceae bacterium]